MRREEVVLFGLHVAGRFVRLAGLLGRRPTIGGGGGTVRHGELSVLGGRLRGLLGVAAAVQLVLGHADQHRCALSSLERVVVLVQLLLFACLHDRLLRLDDVLHAVTLVDVRDRRDLLGSLVIERFRLLFDLVQLHRELLDLAQVAVQLGHLLLLAQVALLHRKIVRHVDVLLFLAHDRLDVGLFEVVVQRLLDVSRFVFDLLLAGQGQALLGHLRLPVEELLLAELGVRHERDPEVLLVACVLQLQQLVGLGALQLVRVRAVHHVDDLGHPVDRLLVVRADRQAHETADHRVAEERRMAPLAHLVSRQPNRVQRRAVQNERLLLDLLLRVVVALATLIARRLITGRRR